MSLRPCLVLLTVLAACGGQTSRGSPAGDGGSQPDVGSGGSNSGSGGSNSGSGGFYPDAGPADPDAPPPPIPSTPNQVRCGNTLCSAATEYCCMGGAGIETTGGVGGGFITTGSGASTGAGGSTGFASCSTSFCGFRRECDETADCVGTEVCCFSVFASPPPILGSRCTQPSDCATTGNDWVGCGTQADCSAVGAPPCVAQPCGNDMIQTCGPVTRSACK